MSLEHTGMKHSAITKQKISLTNKGRKTIEYRINTTYTLSPLYTKQ